MKNGPYGLQIKQTSMLFQIGFFSKDRTKPNRRGEAGSVMILAIVFITVVSVIVGALADWAMNDLNNTTKFTSASSKSYATSSTVELAVQSIRYAPLISQTTGSGSPGYCWSPVGAPAVSQQTLDGFTIAVWCSTVQTLSSANTRVVTFYACQSNLTSSSNSTVIAAAESACQASPYLEAIVSFDDYPAGGSTPLTATCTPPACGYSATTQKWTWAY
jgi:hypothetical protein